MDLPESSNRLECRTLERTSLAYIALDRCGSDLIAMKALDRIAQSILIDVGHRDVCALAAKRPRKGKSDTARRSGDEDRLPPEFLHHAASL
jgi:hypothetical protein